LAPTDLCACVSRLLANRLKSRAHSAALTNAYLIIYIYRVKYIYAAAYVRVRTFYGSDDRLFSHYNIIYYIIIYYRLCHCFRAPRVVPTYIYIYTYPYIILYTWYYVISYRYSVRRSARRRESPRSLSRALENRFLILQNRNSKKIKNRNCTTHNNT